MLLAGGLVAAGLLPGFTPVAVALILGEAAGQSISYAAARFGGQALLDRLGRRGLPGRERLGQVHDFSVRHGRAAVVLARFLPAVRNAIGLAAGLAAMPFAPFLAATLLGSSAVVLALMGLGYLVADRIDEVLALVQVSGLLLLLALGAGLALWWWAMRRRAARRTG